MESIKFEKFQISAERKIQKNCTVCKKKFNIGVREHQCKRCVRAICSDCGISKGDIYYPNMSREKHRICKICKDQSENLIAYIRDNKLVFGEMSEVGRKWIKKITKMPSNHKIDEGRYKKFTKVVYDQMWHSYNYSFKEFIGNLIISYNQDDIYEIILDVMKIITSVFPKEKIENLAYLTVFTLCFCTPDKAAIICLHLLELKSSVEDAVGLIQAYFRALSLSEVELKRLQEYVGYKSKRYLPNLSINHLTAQSSIYLINRIIQRRKIDQLYIYFVLTLDFNKEIIANQDDKSSIDVCFLRNCSVEIITAKYRQLNSVKSILYMREIGEETLQKKVEAMSPIPKLNLESSPLRRNATITSFQKEKLLPKLNEIQINQEFSIEIPKEKINSMNQENQNEVLPFVKKPREIEPPKFNKQQFTDDSFSIISMLSMVKQSKDLGEDNRISLQNNNILGFLGNGQNISMNEDLSSSKSNDKIQIEESNHPFEEEEFSGMSNNKISKTSSSEIKETNHQIQEKYRKMEKQMQVLKEESKNYKKNIEKLEKQNIDLKNKYKVKDQQLQKINKKLLSFADLENQIKKLKENESQFKKMKEKMIEFQSTQKQLQNIKIENFQYKKSLKKYEIEVVSYKQKLDEASSTNIMLKNTLENNNYYPAQNQQIKTNNFESEQENRKVNEMLKSSLLEKNQQIETLMKKNKLLSYQLQDINKTKIEDKEKTDLKIQIAKLEKEKLSLVQKMKELSEMLMQEEEEKLNLSEENFNLRQILTSKGIILDD